MHRLMPLIYEELRRIAHAHMRGERPDHTLEPTALVHQAYERLLDAELDYRNRAHFLNLASRIMRRVLVDYARARRREKRGSGMGRVTLDPSLKAEGVVSNDILALDSSLEELSAFDHRKASLVQAHYFGGLSYLELADAFEISAATVHRELRMAKAWLAKALA